jgi:hypothetical protein
VSEMTPVFIHGSCAGLLRCSYSSDSPSNAQPVIRMVILACSNELAAIGKIPACRQRPRRNAYLALSVCSK